VPRLSLIALAFALTSLLWVGRARAENDTERDFASANAALKRGATTEAIDTLELLADRGVVHPDVSFERAVAYVERARSSSAAPGDLGRAAAALEETLLLRPDDEEAETGLARIRSEISRRHAREGTAPVMARPSLGRAVTSLFPENVWAVAAALGSLLLTLGLALRRFVHRTSAQLAGAIGVGVGAVLLVLGGAMAGGARHFRLKSTPAVVVVEEAHLLDESGKPFAQKTGNADSVSIPEGASVYVLERKQSLVKVEWGSTEGWLTPGQVRLLSAVPTT